jgi:hypothetical protein
MNSSIYQLRSLASRQLAEHEPAKFLMQRSARHGSDTRRLARLATRRLDRGSAEAEAHRLGITDSNQENAFGDAYTTALIANGHLSARGTSEVAAESEGANDALSGAAGNAERRGA